MPFDGTVYDIDCDHGTNDCQVILKTGPGPADELILRTPSRGPFRS
jgi:hypothetical protein